MAENELIIKILGDAQAFEDELNRLRKKTQAFENQLATVAKVSAAAFVALTAAVGASVVRFSEFEKSFSNVITLLDKSSFSTKSFAKGVNDLKSDVLKLGATSGQSFADLNKGLFDLISAGVKAEDSIGVLTEAVNLAEAGATDVTISVKALTSAITSYGTEAGSARSVAEKFFTAQKYGVTTVGDLAQEFNKVGGLGKTLNVSFNELLAASTALTNNGAKPTAEAFTEMRGLLTSIIQVQGKLADESPAVAQALSLQNIETKGLVGSIQEAYDALGGNTVRLQELIPNIRGLSAALSLTGAPADTFKIILTAMNDEQGRSLTFAEALAVKNATTEQAFQKLKTSVDAVAIVFGEVFAPVVNRVAETLSLLAQRFVDLDKEEIKNLATLAEVGLVISGIVGGLATFGLVATKTITVLRALNVILGASRIAAAAFWGSITLGIGFIIAFLPEIISGFKSLLKLIEKPQPKTLDETNAQLEKLYEQQKKLQDQAQTYGGTNKNLSDARLSNVNAEISALEKLKEQIEKTEKSRKGTEEKGGGRAIAQKQREQDALLALDKQYSEKSLAIKQAQTDALNLESQNASKQLIDAKSQEAETLGKIDELEKENRKLKQQEGASELIDGQITSKQQKIDILTDHLEQLRSDADIYAERDFERDKEIAQAKRDLKLEQYTIDQEQDAEFQAINDENKAVLTQQEIDELTTQLQSKNEIKAGFAKQELDFEIKRRNQYLADELKYGKAYAEINKLIGSKTVQDTENAANQLVAMQNSKNATLKAI